MKKHADRTDGLLATRQGTPKRAVRRPAAAPKPKPEPKARKPVASKPPAAKELELPKPKPASSSAIPKPQASPAPKPKPAPPRKSPRKERPRLADAKAKHRPVETCVTVWWREGMRSDFYAVATGGNGREYIAARSPEFEWAGGDVPPEAALAHHLLVVMLADDGWRPVDTEGPWYRRRFERSAAQRGRPGPG